MCVDLFSSFDDFCHSSRYGNVFVLIWLPYVVVLQSLFSSAWVGGGHAHNIVYVSVRRMAALFFSPIRGLSFIIIGVFLGVILGNFIGIVPYAYTPSSHFVCTLILIVPMWISMLVSSIFYNYNFFIAHLVPNSSPEYIAPFLCVSEMLSNLFRGVTLPSRLTLNMICGHLALSLSTLCSDYLYLVSNDSFFLSGAFTSALSVIEVLVCCLQLYILVSLLLVYADEHTPAKV